MIAIKTFSKLPDNCADCSFNYDFCSCSADNSISFDVHEDLESGRKEGCPLVALEAQPEQRPITEDDYAYCAECDHVEMCRWYPMYGCEFKSRPSAQRTGKWIDNGLDGIGAMGIEYRWKKCSECGHQFSKAQFQAYPNYCQNCGRRMEEQE